MIKRCPICDLDLDVVVDEETGVVGYMCDRNHYSEFVQFEPVVTNIYVIGKEKFTSEFLEEEAIRCYISTDEVLDYKIGKEKDAWREQLAEKLR